MNPPLLVSAREGGSFCVEARVPVGLGAARDERECVAVDFSAREYCAHFASNEVPAGEFYRGSFCCCFHALSVSSRRVTNNLFRIIPRVFTGSHSQHA